MAGSVNKVILVGNLGADPEIRDLPSGQSVANLRIATSENWTDKSNGERRERTEWHSVSVFSPASVSYVQSYLKKGSKIYVEGKLQTRKWQDQTGQDRCSTEIVVNNIGGQVIGLRRGVDGDVSDVSSGGVLKLNDPDFGDVPF